MALSGRPCKLHGKDVRTISGHLRNIYAEEEIESLNRIVMMWLGFVETQARRRKQVFLREWMGKLDQFLELNERNILDAAGKISQKRAKQIAAEQYEIFAKRLREMKERGGVTIFTYARSINKG